MSEWFDNSEAALTGALIALAIMLAAIAISGIVRRVLEKALDRRLETVSAHLLSRVASYGVLSIGLVYALDSLGVAIGPIIGALGIAGIALAFALQDLLENFIAGLMLQLRRPFNYGDEIQSGDTEGMVMFVDARTVAINTADGELVRLPSALVIKSPLINHTRRGARRTTLEVGVAYGTDLDMAVRVFQNATAASAGVLADPPPAVLVEEFGDSSVNLAIRFWHEPSIAGRWTTRSAVGLAIDAATREHGITIPFPQRVLHQAPGS